MNAARVQYQSDEFKRLRQLRIERQIIEQGRRAYASEWIRAPEPPIERVQRMLNRVEQRMVRRGKIDLRRMDRRFWEMLFVCGWNPHWFDFLNRRSVDAWWTSDTEMDEAVRFQLMDMSSDLFDAEVAFPDQERAVAEDSRTRSRDYGRPGLRSDPGSATVGGCNFPPFSGRETTGLDDPPSILAQ